MNRPEQDLQKAVCSFIDLAAPDLRYFHVPNGGARSQVEGAQFKAMGVKAGVPDLVILLPNAGVGFIELKARKGSLSKPQKQWRDDLRERGYRWAEARSVEDVEDLLAAWLLPWGWKLRATVKSVNAKQSEAA